MTEVSNRISLDWDIDYSTVEDSRLYSRCFDYCKVHDLSMRIRRSASGNVHVEIFNQRSAWTFLQRLTIRAYLGDDAFRIANDLKRSREGKHTDVLFDSKLFTIGWKLAQLQRLQREIEHAKHEYARIMVMETGEYKAGEWEGIL